MKGYLQMPEKTAEVIELIDGYRWYRTGDKGHLDEDGFLTIVDRYSRFAKIGGEMISLTNVEEEILDACNDKDLEIAATCLPDQRKGEKIELHATIKLAKTDAIVMNHGPDNRGNEVDSSVAEGPQSVILKQVTNGIAVRIAAMEVLAGAL